MSAITAGWRAGVREFRDPGSQERGTQQYRLADAYTHLWAYYRNAGHYVYAGDYCTQNGLYRHTRLLFNPVPTIVSFYEDHLFPGVSEEVKDDGGKTVAHLATPADDSAPLELKLAIAQLDQWGNWLSEASRMVRYGAATGSVGVEVLDLLESEKVAHRLLWPSLVSDVRQDEAGNVKEYALEYKAVDPKTKEQYQYRKEVDGNEFRYFRAGRPFDPPERQDDAEGKVSTGVYENPYGFVPMVWIKHTDDGDVRGLPAVWNLEKVDEVNSLASHGNDHSHKAIEAPKAIATDGEILPVTGADGVSKRNEPGGITPFDTRYDWMLVKMPAGSTVHDLGSTFDLSKLDPEIDRILKSFEKDYPELQAHEIIQNKSQLSGAALRRLLAPSQSKLDKAFAVYGLPVVRLRQMGVAIAGWRVNGGGWMRRDNQRDVFRPFGLDSYSKGALNFGLKRPLLVEDTPMEEEELKAKQAESANALKESLDPVEYLVRAGYTRERAVEIVGARGKANGGEGGE